MNSWIPREPANTSLNPELFSQTGVDHTFEQQVCEACGLSGKVFRLVSSVTPPFGFYKLEADPPGAVWFIKVVPKDQVDQQQQANDLARVLQQRGIKTNCFLDGFPKLLNEYSALLAYPWITGRYLKPDKDELRLLGHNMAQMHLALHDLPMKNDIQQATQSRLNLINKAAEGVLKGIYNSGPAPELIQQWIEKEWHDLSFSISNQVIHGDLNMGNVLFLENEGDIVFLDFEDAVQSWLPPIIDLSMALERFVLINTSNNEQACNLSKNLIEGYLEIYPHKPFQKPGDLYRTLLWAALRSCCLLNIMEAQGQGIFTNEWSKQLQLLEHLESHKNLLTTIETPYLE